MITNTTTTIPVLKQFKELYNPEWRNIVYYGGRASGKSHAVAQALLVRGRQKKYRILCTREMQNTIKDSVHKLLADLIEQYDFSEYLVQRDTIVNLVTGTEFIFKGLRLNINEIKSTEGIDICWVEEAQSVTQQSINVLTPTIRKQGSQMIFTFNRFNELDPVFTHYVIGTPEATYVRKVNYDVLEKAGLLPDVIKLEIESDKHDPDLFAHKWLGEPLAQGEFSVIGRSNILEAMQREVTDDGAIIVGVDVARMGDDRTVFWKRKGLKTIGFKVYKHKRTTEVCDLLDEFVGNDKTIEVKVDDTGVGGGVTDELKKRGQNVRGINFGGRPNYANKYPNLISEAWFELKEQIDQVQLPFNDDLVMELSTRQWKQDNKGKRAIESKQDYKRRGFRSPDLADACIICYYSGKRTVRAFTNKPAGF